MCRAEFIRPIVAARQERLWSNEFDPTTVICLVSPVINNPVLPAIRADNETTAVKHVAAGGFPVLFLPV